MLSVEKEIQSLINKLLRETDFDEQEIYARSRALEIGRMTMETILRAKEEMTETETTPDVNYKDYGYRNRHLLTLIGSIEIRRKYYYDPEKQSSKIPFDEQLGITESPYSVGISKVVSRIGAYMPFGSSEQQLKELTGIFIDDKTIERITKEVGKEVWDYNHGANKLLPDKSEIHRQTMYLCMDGTGIPMNKESLSGRKGKNTEEAKTREVKLGCIFTQMGVDSDGYPKRQEASTTYIGGIINAETLGTEAYKEANERGYTEAEKFCIVGDGAAWIWNIAEEYFPKAVQIVDLYHAREHYWNVARSFFSEGEKRLFIWTEKRKKELDEGSVGKVIKAIRQLKAKTEKQKLLVEKEIGYFNKHKNRMRYKTFRKENLFVGSGVLEAGCRSVIGQRLKQSGMHWSIDGANSLIALRCCIYSNQWGDFWENRAA